MTIVPSSTLYNQSVLNDEDFVANFVARHETLEILCRRLLSVSPGGDGQHQILIGARGMGKTSLLRRLAIEVHRRPDLSERFIPLMFREEQYNVLRLRDFWRNCGESLAEWAEGRGLDTLAARLDADVFSDAWGDDDRAAEQFDAELKALGKRAVLLVDNLDLLLDGLKKDARWTLRGSLQVRGGPIIVGAATRSLREASDRDAAFYEFFQPYFLDPLELPETEKCMRTLAKRRGEAGRRVMRVLRTDPARLRVLHRLTGGNPRVLALTYRLLETTDSQSAMTDLERLLDEVTPYYKARVEEYQTPLQRAIIDAIALHWDPVTTGEISSITGVPTTTLSPQLSRLRKDGLIEKTQTSGSYAGHQIVERFLNIWYLMRHGTRRTKQRMRWLVAFLSSFYTRNELAEINQEAREAGHFDHWTSDYAQAFAQAMQMALPQQQVKAQADMLREGETEDPISPDAQDALAMVSKGMTLGREGDTAAAIEVHDALIARYGDSDAPQVQAQVARAMASKGMILDGEGDTAAVIEVYDALIARYGDSDAPQVQAQVARAMVSIGMILGGEGDTAAAIEVHDALIARYGDSDAPQVQPQVALAMVSKGITLGREGDTAAAIEVHDALIARYGDSDAPQVQPQVALAMASKGMILDGEGDTAAAIEVYDALIARYGDSDAPQVQAQVARAMVSIGMILGGEGDTAAAIEVHDALIARYGDSDAPQVQAQVALAMVSKGVTLGREGDTAAAIEVHDALIARYGDSDAPQVQEQVAHAMVSKGMTLGREGDTAAAIEVHDALIARYGDSDAPQVQAQVAHAMGSKGMILDGEGDTVAEIEVYDALIARYGDSDAPQVQEQVAHAMASKGMILDGEGDTAAAIEVYDALIARYGDSDAPQVQAQVARAMGSKGMILDGEGDTVAEIEVYDALIARYGDSDAPQMQAHVARAMFNKGVTLGREGDTAAEIEVYDALIARYGDSDASQVQPQVARAMLNKGITLGREGDTTAAIEVYDALIARYGDSDAPQVQAHVARAMLNKGITLGREGDTAAEIEVHDALIARYGDSDAPQVQAQVALAMVSKGVTLGREGDTTAEIEVHDALIARYGDSDAPQMQEQVAQAKIMLANRLIDSGVDADRAEALLLEAEEHKKTLAYGNLFWLYLSTNRLSKAREVLNHLDDIPFQGRALMDSALALKAENFGELAVLLNVALDAGLTSEDWDFTDDLERLIRLAIQNGFGARLIDWFEKTRFSDRYAPIQAALKAAVHGEDQLLDTNPEIRHAAGLILRRLSPETNPDKDS